MVRPVLHAISKLCEHVEVSPLDSDELESGTVAWAALMYQYGAMLDGRVLVALWIAAITPVRVIEFMEKRREKEAKRLMEARAVSEVVR